MSPDLVRPQAGSGGSPPLRLTPVEACPTCCATASVSEMITSTIHPVRSRRDPTAFALARQRAGLLLGLASGRVQAIRRCEPAEVGTWTSSSS